MTVQRLFLAPVILTSILGVHGALAQPLSADPTGEARVVAMAELKGKLPALFFDPYRSDPSVMKATPTLGDPFVWYWPDSTFLTQYGSAEAEREARELLWYFQKSVSFPVCVEDRVLGIIHIRGDTNGVWTAGTAEVGDRTVRAMAECRQSATVKAGQRVSILHTAFAGQFAVVDDGTHIFALIPLDKGTWMLVENAVPTDETWILPERVYPMIARKVRATREQELGKKPEQPQPGDNR